MATLLQRIGIAMLIFSLCRLLFYLFNLAYFPHLPLFAFIYGLRFDFAAVSMYYSLFILLSILPLPWRFTPVYQSLLKWLFMLSSILCIVLNCIDLEYYKFTLKRTTADLAPMIGLGKDFLNLLPAFLLDYWYVVVTAVLLIACTAYLYGKTQVAYGTNEKSSIRYYGMHSLIMLITLLVFVYGMRGGVQLRPVNIIHAAQYVDSRYSPVVLNTPFTVIKTVNRNMDEAHYMSRKKMREIFNPVHEFYPQHAFTPLNVMVIIIESLSKEYVGSMSGKTTYTPFLDSLTEVSYVFNRCFANGKESMKGIPAILAGFPSLMNAPYITSAYSGNRINSIASLLKAKGYGTHFFHGGTNGTLGFDAFARSAGFDHYYGRSEYDNESDFDGHWGIYDEPFLQFTANTLNAVKQPFVAAFFSLSSHHPYQLPERYAEKFNRGKFPILPVIQYADLSLRHFFKTASTMPWFKNTLFVITADHTGNPITPSYQTNVGHFAIPLIYYLPGMHFIGNDSKVTQQCDILPGILHLLNYHGACIAFGNDPFGKKESGMSISFMNNVYQLISGDYVLQFNGQEAISLYNYIEDPLLKNELLGKNKREKQELTLLIKAYIQSYTQRIIQNNMTLK